MRYTMRLLGLLCLLGLGSMRHDSHVYAADATTSMAESIQPGQRADIADYAFSVTAVDSDAGDALKAHDANNADPAEGFGYVMVEIEATNIGAEASSPAYGFTFNLVGPSAYGVMSHAGDCGTIPNDGFAIDAVNPGDTVRFAMCWVMADQDRGASIMYVDPVIGGDGPVWFSLGNAAPVFVAPPVPENVVTANTAEGAVPINGTGQTGPYMFTVTSSNLDATDEILAMNAFNEEPAEGERFVRVTITTTYLGEGIGNPEIDLDVAGIGTSGTEYSLNGDSCGILVDDYPGAVDIFTGGSVSTNLCWRVTADDADTLQLRIVSYGESAGEPVWFSLQASSR